MSMAYKVPIPNAFTINRLGKSESIFPLSIEFHQVENAFALYIYPQRVIDICDILDEFGFSTLIVFGVDHFTFSDSAKKPLSLSEVANNEKIIHQAIDTETISIKIDGFRGLFTNLDHYNLHAFDVRPIWQEETVIENVIAIKEHKWPKDKLLLSKLSGANLYIDSHDDCYIYLEALNSDFLKRVVSRTIQSFAGTILDQEFNLMDSIHEIPTTLINTLLIETPIITILRENSSYLDNELKIGISRKKFSLRNPTIYPIDGVITYDPFTEKWQ
jgi:hypothetical protein